MHALTQVPTISSTHLSSSATNHLSAPAGVKELGKDPNSSDGNGDMSISVNGHSFVPPGFRFHPTEEELLNYYLKKKVSSQRIDLDVIRDVDLNKLEPWDIQEECRIGSTPQNEWYFFSHKDKKYPTGTRTNRATAAGFWKATGRDKAIHSGAAARIGMRKTLVFYMGRAPHGQKSDWIMHEYRLADDRCAGAAICSDAEATDLDIDGWVVCRVFKKKNIHLKADVVPKKYSTSPSSSSSSVISDAALDQILQHTGRTISTEFSSFGSPTVPTLPDHLSLDDAPSAIIGDWAAFDRLLASQLNGPSRPAQCCDNGPCFDFHLSGNDQNGNGGLDDCGDLWSVTRTTKSAMSDRISHV